MQSLKELLGKDLIGVDGDLGEVDDFYVDDYTWGVRYMVVDASDWLGRKVLLSPRVLVWENGEQETARVSLSHEVVENSPDISVERPISRYHEEVLHSYYKWPFFWDGLNITGYPLVELAHEVEEKTGFAEDQPNEHLHSLREVLGYTIEARDGNIGHLEDFIVQDQDMKILYLVVDTGTWLPGRKVLVSPTWVEEVDWQEGEFEVDLDRETINNSPPFDGTFPIDREYEERLYEHYRKEKYW